MSHGEVAAEALNTALSALNYLLSPLNMRFLKTPYKDDSPCKSGLYGRWNVNSDAGFVVESACSPATVGIPFASFLEACERKNPHSGQRLASKRNKQNTLVFPKMWVALSLDHAA